MELKRYLTPFISEDLNDKMIFLGGARQVGKTTLARTLVTQDFPHWHYYNWDNSSDRKVLKDYILPGEDSLIILDEIHKYRTWKSFIKGIYDSYKNKYSILVTGSARLNIYRKGGDSLQGRYHYYTLHPFSLAEVENLRHQITPGEELQFISLSSKENLEALYKFGGFPEPFVKQNDRVQRRWQNERLERLFREDIRDTENIRDITSMKLLGDILPSKASGPLSINSISEDLEISHRTVTSWLNILEQFYYHFRIYPYNSSKVRSLKKESKIYMYDWSQVEDEGQRFENMIASHLLKFINFMIENDGYKVDLFYLRNVDKKEVDFLVTYKNSPWFSIEVKLSDTTPSKNIDFFRERLKIPYNYQVVYKKDIDLIKDNIRVISANKFLTALI
jgi:predicted AAA+ superfamily ATPase